MDTVDNSSQGSVTITTKHNRTFIFEHSSSFMATHGKTAEFFKELLKHIQISTAPTSSGTLKDILKLINCHEQISQKSIGYIITALLNGNIVCNEKKPEENPAPDFEIADAVVQTAKPAKKAAKKKVVKEESGENKCTSKSGSTQGKSTPTAKNTPTAGDPVSMITGEELLQLTDFEMPGPLALVWERTYRSSAANIDNGLGFGWTTVFDTEIIVGESSSGEAEVIYRDQENREIPFPLPNPGFESRQPTENLVLRCEGTSEFTIIFPDGTHHVFRPQAGRFRISHISTPRGNALEALYTDKGNVYRIDNRAGRCVFIERQKSGHISAIVAGFVNEKNRKADPLKHTYIRYRYDEEFNLIEAIDACDNSEKYAYNNHIIVQRTLRSGFNLHFEWDNHSVLGKCLRQYGDNGYYDYSFEYKPKVNKTFSRDGRGIKNGYIYNNKGLLLKQIDGKNNTLRNKYDEIGRLVETTDPSGAKSVTAYDENGRLHEIVDARGSSTSYRYNEIDDPIFMTDAEGNVWGRKFDPFGNIIELTDPVGRTTLYEYNLNGTLRQITYPGGRVRKLIWNEKSEFVGDWDMETNSLSEYLYDDLGRMTHALTADGDLTRYDYDANGKVTQIAQGVSLNDYETPLDQVGNEENSKVSKQKFIYNADGRLSQYIDPMGNTTRYGYDGLAHIRKKTMPDGSVFEYLYDEERNLVGLINENGERYRLSYDENENITREVGFDGRTQHYEYDAAGHLVLHKDGESREITYERDGLGNLTKRISKDTQTGEQEICEYTYDRLNRLIHADNNHRRLQFNYDGVGNLLEEWQDDQCITHKYDGDNNRISTALSDGDTINYRYNHKGECTGIQFNDQEIIAVERNLRGMESKRTLPHSNDDSLSIDKHYDPQGRLTQQRFWNRSKGSETQGTIQKDTLGGEQPILEKLYLYDQSGHLIQSKSVSSKPSERTSTTLSTGSLRVESAANLTSINLNGTTDFKYDTLGQLIHADGFTEEMFKLDPAGNLIDGKTDEQQSLDGNRLSQYKGQEFKFDDLGNITQRIDQKTGHKTTFRYNAENQLIETKKAGLTTRYKYDALGRRVQKKDDTGTIDFIWDGDVLISEKRGNSKKVYIHEPNTFRPVAQIQNQNIYHYHLDHLGTPQEITDQQGNLVWQANYSSYGKVISRKVAQIQNNLRFQGQYYDEESDLHYNRHRYFDPSTGRYIHQDPIGLLGGKNAYTYCKNPTSYTDALGLSAAKESPDRSKDAQERKQNPATDNKGASSSSGNSAVNEENHDTHSVSSTGEVKAKQDAPPAAPAASSNSTVQCEKKCSVRYFYIGCGHTTGEKPDRSFKLDLATGSPTRDGKYVYQMISESSGIYGDSGTSIDTLELDYKVSECAYSEEDTCIKVDMDGQKLEQTEAGKFSKNLPSVKGLTPTKILDFLKVATPSRIEPKAHQIQVRNCEGKYKTATVEVYPSVGWKGDISFGYTQSTKIEYDKDSGYNKTNRESPFAITGEIAGHYNDMEWKVGGENKQESAFPSLEKFFNHVMPFFEQLGEAAEHDTSTKAVKVDIKWPHYTMGGKIENAENPDGYDVYTKGEFNVGFNPFIGAEVEVNILPILLKAAKGAGPIGIALVEFLELAMKKCAKGVGGDNVNLKAELALTLTIKAGIKGDLKWEFTPGNVSESGQVNGELGITFEGKANIETKVFIANISAGVLAGIRSAVGADLSAKTSEGKPQFGGKVYFKGITVYYSYYYEVKKAKLEQMDNNAMPTVKPKAEIKDEYDHEFVWIEPIEKEFPAKEKVADQSLAG